jgi:MFS family permease
MQTVGESWLIYRLTGSAFALGAVSVIALLPVVPVSLLGGALIDKVPKRKLLLITQFALIATTLMLALLTWSGRVQIWHIILLDFVAGAVGSIDLPARQAFVAELVGKDDLAQSIALNMSLFNVARAVGPVLAGFVVAVAGEALCFFVNGLSFLPLVLGLILMRDLRFFDASGSKALPGKVIQGLEYLLHNSLLFWLLALMAASNLLLLSYLTMMPVFAQDVLSAGPQGLGLLVAGTGVGAILGSLWLANSRANDKQTWLNLSPYLLPISIIAFTLTRSLGVAVFFTVALGVTTTWMQTLLNTLVQLHVRDDMRGRTLSIYLSLSIGMQRLGGLEAGFLAEFLGVPVSLLLGATLSIFLTTFALWKKPLPLRIQAPPSFSIPES